MADEFYRLNDEDAARLAMYGPVPAEPAPPELSQWRRYSEIHQLDAAWTIPDLIPEGELSVLAGMPGIGKSMLTCRWAAQLSHTGAVTVLASAEDDAERQTIKRLRALEADLSHVIDATVLPTFSAEHPEQTMAWLADRLDEYHPQLMILDPFTAMIEARASSHNDQHMRLILAPLAKLAATTGCAIVYVMHTSKAQGTELLYRVGGSVAFVAAPRSVMLMAVDKQDPEGKRRMLAHVKSSYGELAATQVFEVEGIYLPPMNGAGPAKTARLRYVGVSEQSLDDLFAAPMTGEERSALEEAEQFLLMMLGPGDSVAVTDLNNGATASGISQRTMERARRNVGVNTFREGKAWYVRLSQE